MNFEEKFERFKREYLPSLEKIFKELEKGQKPFATIISCSDSRIIPELIFCAKPGELFVIRNIANIVPPYKSNFSSVPSAIEYSVLHLKVSKIIVLGHSQCGGIKAILKQQEKTPHMEKWLELRKELPELVRNIPENRKLETAEKLNVKLSVKELQQYPPVKEAMKKGLSIEGWYYDFINQSLTRII